MIARITMSIETALNSGWLSSVIRGRIEAGDPTQSSAFI
jgi:hypothetical protein